MRWYQSRIRIVEPDDAEERGLSQCHDCGEWKADPYEFYDGLRCAMCCEDDEEEEE